MTEDHEHVHYHGVDKAQEHPSVDQARKILLDSIAAVRPETVSVFESNNRVLFGDVKSPIDLPSRVRSTRDGYAVNITQNVESGQSFKIVGNVRIGIVPKLSIKPGECVRVATGSFLPKEATAVVMVEYAEVHNNILTTNTSIKVGENILVPGEDFTKGKTLLSHGTRIRPQHVALFSMLGIRKVNVFSKPRVAFFSTGDELIDARKYSNKSATGIYDATRPFLFEMISDLGGVPVDLGIARDKLPEVKSKMIKGLRYDALILSAGSSVGERDFVVRAAESIPGVEILVHGVAMRPSSPTGIAVYKGKPLLFLPGFPTSAMISFFVFGTPAILKLSGSLAVKPPTIKAILVDEYNGKAGIKHFVRVRISREGGEYKASIVRPTEAQYASWLQSANGIAIIDERGTMKRNEIVDVFLIGEITSQD